ncbi:NAD(P)H-binding protein [Fulvivirgaceae bacterium PWU4]|uniref:NAD(P)H-binding protein n=1 Tax=Chryseosolibacter histidini TaxID=2782349 RepID=A0AAP2DL16_9BACT|nr:NAD(P)H-binding protein [Chryseosolibacter histidini]MBT1697474.1 NAD(P)H-binding protein [Chryseosolibacter histidini]
MNKIAFIGATGMLGKPVARELVNAGFTVTALVRDEDKARQLPGSIRCMRGDIRDAAALDALMTGQEGLYISLNLKHSEKKNHFHAETDGLANILTAAKKAGIQRIGFISSLVMRYQGMNNFNWWVFDMKREAVQKVKRSGIPYTIFYPSTFIDNFETTYRMGSRILLAGTSHHKMHFISAADYGKQVARSFQILRNENREYVVQGPEAFTADEAAEEYIRHYKKGKLAISRAPLGLLRLMARFSQKMDYGVNIIEALNNYPERFEAQNTWNELGKPMTTIRSFAENN